MKKPDGRGARKSHQSAIVLEKIISGGQTGPDRAALDFALAHGLPHGGWCPRGRWAEDGPVHSRYLLTETPEADPKQRTEWNVRDSDGTVIFSIAPLLTGGSQLTAKLAQAYRKPWLHVARERDGPPGAAQLARFLHEHKIRVLNVAGPRRSGEPAAGRFALSTLEQLIISTHSI
jgi:hypothetical protein